MIKYRKCLRLPPSWLQKNQARTPATGSGAASPRPSKASREAVAVSVLPKPGAAGAGCRSTKSCVRAESLRSLLCDQPPKTPREAAANAAAPGRAGGRGPAGFCAPRPQGGCPGRQPGASSCPRLRRWVEFWREEKPPVGRQGKGTCSPISRGSASRQRRERRGGGRSPAGRRGRGAGWRAMRRRRRPSRGRATGPAGWGGGHPCSSEGGGRLRLRRCDYPGACPEMGCSGLGQKGGSARARENDRAEWHRRGGTAAQSPVPSGER